MKRSQNVPISGPILQQKALEFATISKETALQKIEQGTPIPAAETAEPEFSRAWIDRFKRRYDIKWGKLHGEGASVSTEVTSEWIKSVWPSLKRRYSECDIFNGDETGLFYKMSPNSTLKFKGDKCSGGKLSKERLTVFVCANMNGSEKRKLVVIGKPANPRCFKNLTNLPVTYYANKRAWVTSEIFEKILRDWDTELSHKNRKILLLIDNCPAHPKVPNLRFIQVVFFPPNVTAVLQPMDQGVIRCLKAYYKKQLIVKVITAIDNNEVLKITILDAIVMLEAAWNCVTNATISNCFRHSGLNMIENEYDEEDEIPLAQWIQREKDREREEGIDLQDWAQSNSITEFDHIDLNEFVSVDDDVVVAEFPSYNQIIEEIASSSTQQVVDDENDAADEVEEEMNLPTSFEALRALEIVNKFVSFNDFGDTSAQAVKLIENKIIEKIMSEKRQKQTKMTDYF